LLILMQRYLQVVLAAIIAIAIFVVLVSPATIAAHRSAVRQGSRSGNRPALLLCASGSAAGDALQPAQRSFREGDS
jgi:hypothetical protein